MTPDIGRRTIAAAMTTTVLVVAPLHLLGALAVLVRDDLGFGKAALGTAFAVYNVGALAVAWPAGHLAERLGARRSMLLAGGCTGVAVLGIALFADAWWQLALALLLAGVGNGIGQPSAGLALADGVRPARQGLAFGMKQSAVPVAGMLAGLAVPAVGLTVGWRWAFGAVVLGVVVLASVTPDIPRRAIVVHDGDAAPPVTSRGSTILLVVAFAFGSAAAMTTPTFLAESAVAAGHSPTFAGLVVFIGSTVGLVSRLNAGARADRRGGRHLRVVALMIGLGTLGHVAIAFADVHIAFLLVGAAVAYGAGWGWPGLLLFAIVRLYPDRPGAASGRTQAGGTVGALVGPFTFGWLVSGTTFRVGWLVVAATGLVAAVLVHVARLRLARERGAVTPPPVPVPAA